MHAAALVRILKVAERLCLTRGAELVCEVEDPHAHVCCVDIRHSWTAETT